MGINKHIFLTGFMGAGKTTVGKELSKFLTIPVVDTDDYIEEKTGRKIAQIFQQQGETSFRDLETDALKVLIKQPVQIITTGGGIIVRKENRALMKKTGVVIFLYCNIEETSKRLMNDTSRPLLNRDNESNQKLFAERLPLYRQANIEVETTNKTIENIVAEIIAKLE